MSKKLIVVLLVLVALGPLCGAFVDGVRGEPILAGSAPASDLYARGVHTQGIVRSDEPGGGVVDVYADVPGPVVRLLVSEGQVVAAGAPVVQIDDTLPRALVEQQKAMAEEASARLAELRARPRREVLEVEGARLELARAELRSAMDVLDEQQVSFSLHPDVVSKDALGRAIVADDAATWSLALATQRYELTRAGTSVFEISSREREAETLAKQYADAKAQLVNYTVRAPAAGLILATTSTAGTYVVPRGARDARPVVVLGEATGSLVVRCYLDESLGPPSPERLHARMLLDGGGTAVPLEFVRLQPSVLPERFSSEREGVRTVLPFLFRVPPPRGVSVFPGQRVDLFIWET